MFGIGGTEFAIILIFAFLIFGPDKLPAIAKTIGQAIAKFRDVQGEMNQVVKEEIYDPEKDQDNPFQKPLDKMAQMDQRQVKTETFAERKARHDRERAERQAAMENGASASSEATGVSASNDDAASDSEGAGASAATVAAAATVASAVKPATKAATAAEPERVTKPRPKVSAAELYGMPATHKPAPKTSNDSHLEGSE